MTDRAITRESLGAWLIKGTGSSPATGELLRTGFASLTTRCVRASYRTDLMAAGDPVLFWVSGDERDRPPGIHGQGRLTGAPVADPSSDRPGSLVVPLRLAPVDPPVPRAELRAHPELAAIEVLRMPAGSNPSFVTTQQLDALRQQWPEVTVR